MKFIDEAVITVRAGHGGPGSRSFRREKFVPMGGPDGGDGGDGGSVILIADRSKHTLLDFRFQPQWVAEDGKQGQGRNKAGKAGHDLVIKVPVGTQIFAEGGEELVADLASDGQELVLAKGGRGGKGNAFFRTPTNQAPEHAQPGEDGEAGTFILSLKLVADVGLIGFPNAGKSTLISRISAARPKIADYPFTTLTPNLGVAQLKGKRSFVVADIPGLIPGAHEGRGLGIKFLKHIERTRVLAHLIEPYQLDEQGSPILPLDAFEQINKELAEFSPELAQRKQLVVLTKIDTLSKDEIEDLLTPFKELGLPCYPISSVSGQGVEELLEALASAVFRDS